MNSFVRFLYSSLHSQHLVLVAFSIKVNHPPKGFHLRFETPVALFSTPVANIVVEFYQQQVISAKALRENQAYSAVTDVMGYGRNALRANSVLPTFSSIHFLCYQVTPYYCG